MISSIEGRPASGFVWKRARVSSRVDRSASRVSGRPYAAMRRVEFCKSCSTEGRSRRLIIGCDGRFPVRFFAQTHEVFDGEKPTRKNKNYIDRDETTGL